MIIYIYLGKISCRQKHVNLCYALSKAFVSLLWDLGSCMEVFFFFFFFSLF